MRTSGRGLAFWLAVLAIGAGLLGWVTGEMVLAAGLAVGGLWLLWFVVGFRGGGLGSVALGLLVAGVVVGLWSGDLGGGSRGVGQGMQVPGSGFGVLGFGDLGIGGQGRGIGCGAGGGRVLDLDAPGLVGGSCGRDWGSWVPVWGMGRWLLTLAVLPFGAVLGFLVLMAIVGRIPLIGRDIARSVAGSLDRSAAWVQGRGGADRLVSALVWLADRVASDRQLGAVVRSRSGTHGSDRRLQDREALELWAGEEPGIVLGRSESGELLQFRGEGPMLLEARPGGGKSTGVVEPSLLLPNTDAHVILDVKGALYAKTARYRRELGQKILVVDPERLTDLGQSGQDARMNILLEMMPDLDEDLPKASRILATGLIPPLPPGDKNEFFVGTAIDLLIGYIVFVRCASDETLSSLGLERSLLGVRQLLERGDPRDVIEKDILPLVDDIPAHGKPMIVALKSMPIIPDVSWGSIPRQVAGALTFLTIAGWRRALCAEGAEPGQIWRVCELYDGGVDVYLVMQLSLLDAYPAAPRLLIASIVESLIAEGTRRRGAGLKRKVRLILDEVRRLGKCLPLIQAVEIGRTVCRPLFVVQAWHQFTSVYGESDAKTLMQSFAIKAYFGAGDGEAARRISDETGSMTIKSRSRSGQGHGAYNDRSYNDSETGVPVFRPGDILHMPEDRVLVIQSGKMPAMLRSVRSWRDAPFVARRTPDEET
jgi:type IV secretory pathway TraG/TraD family ATPase VirD4